MSVSEQCVLVVFVSARTTHRSELQQSVDSSSRVPTAYCTAVVYYGEDKR